MVCPSCGRRVPRAVTVCRCGTALPFEDDSTAGPDTSPAMSRSTQTLVWLLIVAALAGTVYRGYWIANRPSRTILSIQPDAPSSAPEPRPTPAKPAPELSPEARAWNLLASAKDIAPADKTDTSRLPAPPAAPAGSVEEMLDRVMPAVVLIETTTGRGSGFYVSNDTLITNVHVVQNDGYVTLRQSDGSTVSARVAAKAPAYDLAVLKVANPSVRQVMIPMGTTRTLRAGQEVIVIGSALGTLQNSVSRGIVSALRSAAGATLVQTDAAVNPGNSGGPMLDKNGAVIAITTMGYRNAEGLNFGVAIDHARDLLEGRLENAGATNGLQEIQSQSAAQRPSDSERQQQQGEQQLRARIGQLANAAGDLDVGWKRFRSQCYQAAIPGSYDREWFVMLVPGGMPANSGAGCPSYYSTMESQMKQFQGLMRTTLSDARHADVLPGTIRDLLRANHLEFEWDR